MNMTKHMMNTKFGRTLKRLIGEESGQALMEYVILAVMIAAACVVAVIYFGKTANKQVQSATLNMSGETEKGSSASENAQSTAGTGATKADAHNKKFSDVEGK